MANKILIKRASTAGKVPLTSDIDLAELAINTYDGRLFAKTDRSGTSAVVDLKQNDPVRILGDATSTYAWDQSTYTSNVTMTLNTVNSNTGVFGGKAGGTITIPIVTVNDKGLVTAVSTTTYSAGGDLGNLSTQNSNNINVTGGNISGVAITAGSIDNTPIGATTANTGKFTTIQTSSDVTVGGNLYVQGVTTTVNSTTVAVGDLNIELAKDAATAAAANGAGITVKGPATPATITYASADNSWNVNKKFNGTSATFNSTLDVTGAATAESFAGKILPNSYGVVFPDNVGGLSADSASIVYKQTGTNDSTLEIKATNTGSGADSYIKLNADHVTATGDATVTGQTSAGSFTTTGTLNAGTTTLGATTASSLAVTNALSAGATTLGATSATSLSTTGALSAGTTTLGATTASSIDSTPIGATTASTGAFTTLGTSGAATLASASVTGNLAVGSTKFTVNSSSGAVRVNDDLTVGNSLTVKDLTITGTTSLSGVSTNAVTATQIVYGGTGGAFKGVGDLTYNDSTKTVTAYNISVGHNVSVANDISVTGGATVGQALSVTGATSLLSTLGVTGATTLSSTLEVVGTATMDAALNVTGIASFTAQSKFNSTATFTLATYTGGAVVVAGDQSIAGKLQVQGAIYKGGYEVINTADTIDGGTF
jgi:hypothetical protein